MSVVIKYQEEDTMPMLGGVVSGLLRAANIPSILWGDGYYCLLGMHQGNLVSVSFPLPPNSENDETDN